MTNLPSQSVIDQMKAYAERLRKAGIQSPEYQVGWNPKTNEVGNWGPETVKGWGGMFLKDIPSAFSPAPTPVPSTYLPAPGTSIPPGTKSPGWPTGTNPFTGTTPTPTITNTYPGLNPITEKPPYGTRLPYSNVAKAPLQEGGLYQSSIGDIGNFLYGQLQQTYNEPSVVGQIPTTAGQFKGFQDYYKPPTDTSENQFQDLIKTIGAPSSVDEAKKAAETEQLKQMLTDIGRQTDTSVANTKMDFLDRGMAGPGQMSDIEAVGLAQARGSGEEAMNRARLTAYQSELDRQKARETNVAEAYKTRYGAGVEKGTQERQIAAAGAQGDVDTYAKLLGIDQQTAATLIALQKSSGLDLAKLLSSLYTEERALAGGKYVPGNSGGGGGGGFSFGVSPAISF